MKTFRLLFVSLLLWSFGATVQAQWRTETYTLKGGWNSIYLNGDARQDTLDNLFPAQVLEVWRWNPNPDQVQFTESPLVPSAGTAEWSVWKRGLPAQTTLSQMIGRTAYLVRCSGTTANAYTVQIRQSPLMPANSWVRNGANFLGFPTYKNGSAYPTFTNYFATFPVAIASNTKVYKYVGGELGPSNPIQMFSPLVETLDRTQAYWFSAEIVGNYYAPLEISLSTSNGLAFGRTGSVITARIRNRTAANVTLTLSPVNSEPAPLSQTGITGPVPLMKRTFNTSTLTWEETAISAAYTETIAASSTVELSFGINRVAMTGAANALYASFLRLTESSNQMDVFVPATAQKASLAGLWVGDISLTNVSSKVSNGAKGAATIRSGAVTALAVTGTGGFGYDTAPTVTLAPPVSGTAATATAIVANGSVTGFTLTNSGSGYEKAPAVSIAPPPALTGTGTARPFPLRTLLHVSDDAAPVARLLSQVFIGQLAAPPNSVGICPLETLLKKETKASAQRLVATHLPLDQVITSGSGGVALPGILIRTINVPHTAPTNPFVHQYHPDHDNKKERASLTDPPLDSGVESYTVTRTCTFTFTAAPPSGSSVTSGWGSSVIGGTYTETIAGIHKQTIEVSGTFELRRASEIGTFSQ